MEQGDYLTINKYDREFGNLNDGTAVKTNASTIEHTAFRGETDTYIVQTFRRDKMGDFISLKIIDGNGTYRVILPPKVANIIASQRESLTSRRRSAASKASARARMERGELPGFMRKPVNKTAKKGR